METKAIEQIIDWYAIDKQGSGALTVKANGELFAIKKKLEQLSKAPEAGDKCSDCGAPMNEGEAKTFTCCDSCWEKHWEV